MKLKVYTGGYVLCQCIWRGKKRVCKPKGKAYKFPAYYYVTTPDTNENAPAPADANSDETKD